MKFVIYTRQQKGNIKLVIEYKSQDPWGEVCTGGKDLDGISIQMIYLRSWDQKRLQNDCTQKGEYKELSQVSLA